MFSIDIPGGIGIIGIGQKKKEKRKKKKKKKKFFKLTPYKLDLSLFNKRGIIYLLIHEILYNLTIKYIEKIKNENEIANFHLLYLLQSGSGGGGVGCCVCCGGCGIIRIVVCGQCWQFYHS